MEKRFERNIPTISEEEQKILKASRVAIIGLGGLGGYLCEMAVRLGIEKFVVCDGDVFDETNLNRQLLSSEGNIGMLKSEASKAWIESINPSAMVDIYCQPFNEKNAFEILDGCDIVLDALDNTKSRLLLEDECAKLNIPIVHGAIQGFTAQVGIALPGHNMLHKLYGCETCGNASDNGKTSAESSNKFSTSNSSDKTAALKSTLVCTPAFCASLQIAQAVTLLCKKEAPLTDKLLIANLDLANFNIIPIN